MKSLQQQQRAAGAGSMTQSKGSTRYVCVGGSGLLMASSQRHRPALTTCLVQPQGRNSIRGICHHQTRPPALTDDSPILKLAAVDVKGELCKVAARKDRGNQGRDEVLHNAQAVSPVRHVQHATATGPTALGVSLTLVADEMRSVKAVPRTTATASSTTVPTGAVAPARLLRRGR